MNGTCLEFGNHPIKDAISRIRFAPRSNNLLISSWDSSLRLYDVDRLKLRLEAPGKAALLDCCFQDESVACTAASDCSVRRHDLHSGVHDNIGSHEDLATCIEYSDGTSQVITAGWDKKIRCWDSRSKKALSCVETTKVEVESMSLRGSILMVAVGVIVNIYDLRKFNESLDSKCADIQIKCVRPTLNFEGFAAGSVDGRVALKYFNPSNSNNDGLVASSPGKWKVRNIFVGILENHCKNGPEYAFRCHPKAKDRRHDLAAVNDIAFNPSSCGVFVTGDNDGYVTLWNAQSKKRLFEMPRCHNSIASLSYNSEGQFLAVASSHTYQEGNEMETPPQIFIHEMDNQYIGSFSAGGSK